MAGSRPVTRTLADVGIKATIGDHPKVFARFKERYSDFHVHEIDLNGKRVQLTDLGLPKEAKITVNATDPELVSILPEETRNQVEALHTLVEEKKHKDCSPVEIDVTQLDKQQRTKIHRWIANYSTLSSSTLEKGDKKFIKVEYATKKTRLARRPETRLKYTHCVLFKEGIETSDAIGFIAKNLRIQPNLITYAGTKDKQGKTTQRICLSNVDPRRIIDVSNRSRNTKMGNFEYANTPLTLGALKGNHFHILLKDVRLPSNVSNSSPQEVVEKAVNILRDVGFINFYGLQRFGSFDASTHAIGKAVLQMKWDRAFDLILQPRPNDQDFMVQAKKMWFSERDAIKIIKVIPNFHRSIESNLFHGLSRHYQQRDYISAFQRIPRAVRSLYLHAFQSFLWNNVASFRVEKFGLKPIVGDCVYVKKDEGEENSEQLFEDLSLNIDMKALDTPELPETDTPAKVVQQVKTLTQEDLDSGKYTIYDVILPLIGTEIAEHSNKAVQDFYDNLLLEQGLHSDCFSKFKPRQEAPKGNYRHLIVQPKNVKVTIIPHAASENMDKFIPSDMDLIHKAKREANGKSSRDNNSNGKNNGEAAADGPVKDKIAAVVEFSLPASSYATMALREVLLDEDSGAAGTTSESKTTATNKSESEQLEKADSLETPGAKEAVKRPAESSSELDQGSEAKKINLAS